MVNSMTRFLAVDSAKVDLKERKDKLNNSKTEYLSLDDIRGYKVYTALLTQSGTDAPVATVLENTLGNVVWSREGAGLYKATSVNFIDNKTMSFISGITDDYSEGILNTGYVNSYGILLTCKEIASGELLDVSYNSYSSGSIQIEIRVYN